ncbi:hypothetical protein [Halorhabdus rudnickae]|uniref:hypothetical protein n=1 Tax=Halorhabdus rudnickae TaxID=1775544 RepID=UPI001083D5F8|nr:hypothetical protein [Halorhabdus rudnickae]
MGYSGKFEGLVPREKRTVWRYVDYSKLMWILSQGKLHFHRGDLFDDPFEGTLPEIVAKARKQAYIEDYDSPETMEEIHAETTKQIRQDVFLNCWHVNGHESAGMWEIYSNTDKSIVIKSTIGDLISALEQTSKRILMGEVTYLDFDSTGRKQERKLEEFSKQIPDSASTPAEPFLLKRNSFRHEPEFRLLIIDPTLLSEREYEDLKYNIELDGVNRKIPLMISNGHEEGFYYALRERDTTGFNIDINTSELINEIRISPDAPAWFKDAVEATVTASSDLGKEQVNFSELRGESIY